MQLRIGSNATTATGRTSAHTLRQAAKRCAVVAQSMQTGSTQAVGWNRLAATVVLSASLVCGQAVVPGHVIAAGIDVEQLSPAPLLPPASAVAVTSTPSSLTSSLTGAAEAVVEKAEDLFWDAYQLLHRGVEKVESTVHHLQVLHALERLENMPLDQVVHLEALKAAMHPYPAHTAAVSQNQPDQQQEQVSPAGPSISTNSPDSPGPTTSPTVTAPDAAAADSAAADSAAAHAAAQRRLDAALDAVGNWRLRDLVDVGQLAAALQDVPVLRDPLSPRALQREAPRIRRTVHWGAVAEAVKPQALRDALAALGSGRDSPFSEMDVRAAVSAVRMDAVRKVLAPPKKPVAQTSSSSSSHALESSGMWTWESV